MSKKYTIWAVLVAAIIIVAFVVVSVFVKTASDSDQESAADQENQATSADVSQPESLSSGTAPTIEAGLVPANLPVAPAVHQIIYSNGAFAPASLIVKKGDTVAFYNVSGDFLWPASAVHPTHQNYPGSDIAKCGTAEEEKIFDACRPLPPGEDWSFVFTEVGSWNYHNHLRASEKGVIIVE